MCAPSSRTVKRSSQIHMVSFKSTENAKDIYTIPYLCFVRIKVKAYKQSSQHNVSLANIFTSRDLDTLPNHWGLFLDAGDLNSKHTYWNIRISNCNGRFLFHHMEQTNSYNICTPDSHTHYPYQNAYAPDVLDHCTSSLIATQFPPHQPQRTVFRSQPHSTLYQKLSNHIWTTCRKKSNRLEKI